MATTKVYGKAISSLGAAKINYTADAIKAMLCTSVYSPNLDTNQYKSDVTGELAAGGGYSTGGLALTGLTVTYTAANSWGTAWAASTAYNAGDVVRPAAGNGFLYRCVVAGTSGASAPTFPTVVGETVTDGTVTWVCAGTGITVFDAADPAWTSATLSGIRYLVVYDSTPATDATRPLLCLIDFGSDQSVSGGTFTAVLATTGLLYFMTS